MFDPKLMQYAKGSFADLFNDLATELSLKFTLGILDSVAELEDSDYINVRISPNLHPLTYFETKITVNFELILHYIISDDLYKSEKLSGKILEAMNGCIPLKVVGDENATEEVLECFKVTGRIRVANMVNKDQTSRARESVFIAQYETTISQEI